MEQRIDSGKTKVILSILDEKRRILTALLTISKTKKLHQAKDSPPDRNISRHLLARLRKTDPVVIVAARQLNPILI